MKRILIILIMSVGAITSLLAQNDVQFTQYWAVPTYYNPSCTGATDYIRIRGAARLQWIGIEHAPKSFLALADAPFQIGKKRVGVGINASQESIGLFSNMLLNVQASYKFKLLKGQFSIGLQGGYYSTKFKGSEVYIPDDDEYHQSTDTSIPSQDMAGNTFDVSAGVSYTHQYFSVGISGLHLLNPTVKLAIDGSESSESAEYVSELSRALYFTADGNIPLKNTLFTLQPSLMVKTDLSRVTADITMRASWNKFLNFGLGYRYNDAVSVMIGAEFKNFFVGYSYDYPVTAIAHGTSGSHELVAGYQLKLDFTGKNRNKHRSIRIM